MIPCKPASSIRLLLYERLRAQGNSQVEQLSAHGAAVPHLEARCRCEGYASGNKAADWLPEYVHNCHIIHESDAPVVHVVGQPVCCVVVAHAPFTAASGLWVWSRSAVGALGCLALVPCIVPAFSSVKAGVKQQD